MDNIAIIGGGAAGLAAAVRLRRAGRPVTLFERGDRLGRKLSATGNGQGNVTNLRMGAEYYHTDGRGKLARILARFGPHETIAFLESMGGIFLPDARGRVYPAGRQASAVTDLFRRELDRLNADIRLSSQVTSLKREKNGFALTTAAGTERFSAVLLAAGGCAAPNFGTDGSAFSLVKPLGHTVLPLSPVLVQFRCDAGEVRGLKGIRIDAGLTILRAGKEVYRVRGDVLFTESGLSGDAVFRASSYAEAGDTAVLDLLPDVEKERIEAALRRGEGADCLLCLVNNGLGRFLYKKCEGDRRRLAALLKGFSVPLKGTLGFAYAQATRGGVPLSEVTDELESRLVPDLFFAGEMLNVDGDCGGYNLQWAFASACIASEALSCR